MAPYARFEVALIAVAGVGVAGVVWHVLGAWALLPIVLALALLSFYRDPTRRPPSEANVVLAPADGKVVEVTRDVEGPEGRRVLRIMIFLSVLDVHINRSPCAGRVRAVQYKRGEFLNALRADANERNESNTLVLEPTGALPGPIQVRQIAGVLARRIVCTAQEGDELEAGERYGMIKLGSRTEVCLPEDGAWHVLVSPRDKVKAGQTILAQYRPESE